MKNRIEFTSTSSLNDFILFAVKKSLAYTVTEQSEGVFIVFVTGY